MIKYIFTKNNLIGSRLISGLSRYEFQKGESISSHFGILFFDRVVLHSNFANGVHFEPYYTFKKKNDVLSAFKRCNCELSLIESTLLFDQLVRKTYGASYDFGAICFFIWRVLLKKIFGKPIPDKNKWESKSKWFCNEIFEIVLGRDLSMKTPNDLMLLLKTNDHFDSVDVFK
jgi:hypothetical protein